MHPNMRKMEMAGTVQCRHLIIATTTRMTDIRIDVIDEEIKRIVVLEVAETEVPHQQWVQF